MRYGEIHRAILQLFLRHKFLTEAKTVETIQKLASFYPDEDGSEHLKIITASSLTDMFRDINSKIGSSGLGFAEFKRIQVQKLEQTIVFWGLGSSSSALVTEDEISMHLDPKYMEKREILYFKTLICEISKKSDGHIEHNEAIRLGSFGPMTAKDSLQCLDKLVQDNWLEYRLGAGPRHPRKEVTLGLRTLLDLWPYIQRALQPDELCCSLQQGWRLVWQSPRVRNSAVSAEDHGGHEDTIGGRRSCKRPPSVADGGEEGSEVEGEGEGEGRQNGEQPKSVENGFGDGGLKRRRSRRED